jgi:hypothetical protein
MEVTTMSIPFLTNKKLAMKAAMSGATDKKAVR